MKDYRGYDRIQDYNKYSKKKLMDNQLKYEGEDILINGIRARGIIRNNQNPMSETKEDRSFIVDINTILKQGDYIKYDNENYIVISGVDKFKDYYKITKIRKCNQYLKWKGHETPIYGVMTNNSYGTKGEVHNYIQQGDFDSRARIVIQRNKDTQDIYEGMRFCFGSEWDFFEVTKKLGCYTDNCWDLTLKYVKRLPEDDIENRIAFNKKLENNNSETDINYIITGEEYVKENTATYVLEPAYSKVVWSLDEYTIEDNLATIENYTDNSCIIKILVKNRPIQLEARDENGKLLNYFVVYGVR